MNQLALLYAAVGLTPLFVAWFVCDALRRARMLTAGRVVGVIGVCALASVAAGGVYVVMRPMLLAQDAFLAVMCGFGASALVVACGLRLVTGSGRLFAMLIFAGALAALFLAPVTIYGKELDERTFSLLPATGLFWLAQVAAYVDCWAKREAAAGAHAGETKAVNGVKAA